MSSNFISRLLNKNTVPTEDELDLLVYGKQPKVNTKTPEYAENMGVDIQKPINITDRVKNALLGVPAGATENIAMTTGEDGAPMINSTIGNQGRQGGLINDFIGGLRENYNQGFEPSNLEPNANKGFATRIGEGLGTVARFVDSPAGRFALAYGLSKSMGDYNPIQEALMAGVGRQQAITKDKAYRQGLRNLGYTDEQISEIPYNMLDAVYTNAMRTQQLRDNAEYRNLMLENQQRQNDIMNAMRQQQYEASQAQQKFNNQMALANLEDKRQTRADNNYWKSKDLELKVKDAAEKAKGEDFSDIQAQLDNFSSTFKSLPTKAESYTVGKVRQLTGMQTQKEANFNAQRTLLFNQIARKLGGEKGVLSDQDIKRIEASLPSLTDSYEQKQAKMKAVYDLLDIKKGKGTSSDPLGIR